MTMKLEDYASLGIQGPRLKASNTEMVGGSWMRRVMDAMLLNPQPAYDRAVSGEAIQDHASKVGRDDATENQWPQPLSRDLVWALGANDTSVSTTPTNIHNNIFSIMAVAAWVAGGGEFFPSKGGTLSSIYTTYGRMAASSAEGSGVTCNVKKTPGWYVLFFTTSNTERIEGKIEENGRTVGLDWNTSAFENRGFGRDVIGLPYYSDTGIFNVEMWSSLSSGYGVFMGVRHMEQPQSVVICNELMRWDLTDAQAGDRYTTLDMAIRNFGTVWSMMGGGFFNLPLPTLGYYMSDAVHLNQTEKTPYLHAQFINQVLY